MSPSETSFNSFLAHDLGTWQLKHARSIIVAPPTRKRMVIILGITLGRSSSAFVGAQQPPEWGLLLLRCMFGYRGNYLGVIEQRKDGQQHLRYFARGGCLGGMLLRGFLLSISALSTSLCDD